MLRAMQANMPVVGTIPDGRRYGKFLGVYGRILQCFPGRRRQRWYQYIYVWNWQLLPPHPMDYAPVFIFVDDSRMEKIMFYDQGHYGVGRTSVPKQDVVGFAIHGAYHSFRLTTLWPTVPFPQNISVEGLTDDHIWHWWGFQDPHARLVIKDELLDPFLLMSRNSFSGEESAIAVALNLASLLFAASASAAHGIAEGFRTMIEHVTSLSRWARRGPAQQVVAQLITGSFALTSSLWDSSLLEFAEYPDWMKHLPILNYKDGRMLREFYEIRKLSQTVKMEGLLQVASGAADTELSSLYYADLIDLIESDMDLQNELRSLTDLIPDE